MPLIPMADLWPRLNNRALSLEGGKEGRPRRRIEGEASNNSRRRLRSYLESLSRRRPLVPLLLPPSSLPYFLPPSWAEYNRVCVFLFQFRVARSLLNFVGWVAGIIWSIVSNYTMTCSNLVHLPIGSNATSPKI